MARIFKSPNPDFKEVSVPSGDTNYVHPISNRGNHPIPVAFQITSPFDRLRTLLPHTLVMHVNPSNFQETYNQKIERFQTRGGWQEQHWGQDLAEISCEGSTGAFMNIYTGLSSVIRQRTIAWDRYRDLYDLYKHNGSVYDPFGKIVLQGHVMLIYDRGTYIGTFRDFEVSETDDSPFAFKLNWSFKVEHTISAIQVTAADSINGVFAQSGLLAPSFQFRNIPVAADPPPATTSQEVQQQETSERAAEQRRDSPTFKEQAAILQGYKDKEAREAEGDPLNPKTDLLGPGTDPSKLPTVAEQNRLARTRN